MYNILISLLLCVISINAYSARCFVTGVKATCWETYNVNINVVDTNNDKILTTIIIPAQNLWARAEFECNPGANLRFDATFNPVIWEHEKNKVYFGLKFWKLPPTPPKEGEVWNLNLCFPMQFSQVPLPPEAQQRCNCDMSVVEPIEL